MRTAACVASHTVPSSSTTPSNISARIAPARGSGDSIEVTNSVARTRMTIALKVVATIISVVRTERNTCFMGSRNGGVSGQPKHNAFARKAECGEAPPSTKSRSQTVVGKMPKRARPGTRNPIAGPTNRLRPRSNRWGSRGHTSRWSDIPLPAARFSPGSPAR